MSSDKVYSKNLLDILELPSRNGLKAITQYTNIDIPWLLKEFPKDYYSEHYPRHGSKLDLKLAEFILCKSCGSRLQMTRHTSRTNPRLNQKYSTYHPQPLQYCKCNSLALIVDHRGTPRIYGEDSGFELIIQPLGYERRFSEFTIEHIPKGLLESFKRPRIIPTDTSRIPLKTSGIVLNDINQQAKLSFLASPSTPYRFHSRFMEHFLRYAYTYKIMILTKEIIYLPSGYYISTQSLPDELKDKLKAQDFKQLNKAISLHFELPLAELEEYPLQTIGYLHLIKSNTQSWEFHMHNHRYYSQARPIFHLKRLKSTIRKVISQLSFLRNDLTHLQLYTRDHLQPQTLLIPPLRCYTTSKKINPLFTPSP